MAEPRTNGAMPRRKRLLTGLRPTGKFHLGNYVGTFEKDVELQNSGEYECFFLVADFHTLTTGYESARDIGDQPHTNWCFRNHIVLQRLLNVLRLVPQGLARYLLKYRQRVWM